MQAFDLKKLFTDKNYGWNEGFKFEIIFSNSGVARIYINDIKTKYKAAGYGYDKTSNVIAKMINDLIGEQLYDFDSIKKSFENIAGNELNQIYSGKNSNVYEIKFNQEA